MRRWIFLFLLPWMTCAMLLMGQAWAQTQGPAATPSASKWEIRTFRLDPTGLAAELQFTALQQQFKYSTDAAAQVSLIRDTTQRFRDYLESVGFSTPLGTAFFYDAEAATLCVRSTREALAELQTWAQGELGKVPHQLALSLEIVEGPSSSMRQTLLTSLPQPDRPITQEQLETLIGNHQWRRLTQVDFSTRSEQKAVVDAGATAAWVTSVLLNAKGGVEPTSQDQAALHVEVDSVFYPDDPVIQLDVKLRYQCPAPQSRRLLLGQTAALGKIYLPCRDVAAAEFQTHCYTLDQATTLIGLWKPAFQAPRGEDEVLQAAFLKVRDLPMLPNENAKLADQFSQLADQAAPIPVIAEPPSRAQPDAMRTVHFKVPVNFLTFSQEPAKAESEPKPPALEDVGLPHSSPAPKGASKMARQILEWAGITFPPGASVRFDERLHLLTVTHTPKALDEVEAFVTPVICGYAANVIHTLQIFEADAKVMRPLLEEDERHHDKVLSLQKLEELVAHGQAKIVSMQRLMTRYGDRIEGQTGLEQQISSGFQTEDQGRLRAMLTSKSVGTSLLMDPVISTYNPGGNGKIHFEHHYALPTGVQAGPALAPDSAEKDKAFEIAPQALQYHLAKYVLPVPTLELSGQAMIIGVWKPEGAVEYEGKDLLQVAFLQTMAVGVRPVDEGVRK